MRHSRIEDPVLYATVGIVGLIGSLIPVVLDLAGKALRILLCALLDLLTL